MKPRIGVVGKDGEIPEELKKIAGRVGEEIAKKGAILICGGRGGVMEAACQGAKKFNGTTVGILPSMDREDANPCVDIPITTGMGYARNAIVVSSSDAIIVIDGSVGTLSEITLALNYRKPVIMVKGSGGAADFKEEIDKLRRYEKVEDKLKVYEADVEDAVEVALKLIK